RLLAELRAGILVDQHGALAQLLELVGKDVADDAVAGGARLVIGEAIPLHVLSAGSGGEERRAQGRRRENPQNHAVLPCWGGAPAPAASASLGTLDVRERAGFPSAALISGGGLPGKTFDLAVALVNTARPAAQGAPDPPRGGTLA